MRIPLHHVDAFTDRPFAGNPAAVCLLTDTHDADWMQRVAAEMNLSETAFVRPIAEGFELRWFTPTIEVDLCGHATLAAAHTLWRTGRLEASAPARFSTRSGWLRADRRDEWIELDSPSTPASDAPAPAALTSALGAAPRYVGKSKFDYLVELESEAAVRDLRPDFATLGAFEARGVIVTSRASESACDFVSRYFAPAYGINEDPVTGSAHCCLAPFWSRQLGQTSFVAHQISARGGVLRVRLEGDRVKLGGAAVTIAEGTLCV